MPSAQLESHARRVSPQRTPGASSWPPRVHPEETRVHSPTPHHENPEPKQSDNHPFPSRQTRTSASLTGNEEGGQHGYDQACTPRRHRQVPADAQLTGCVADALSMGELLRRNENNSPNYECRVLTSTDCLPVTRERLRSEWHALFDNFDGHNPIFHFSGMEHRPKPAASWSHRTAREESPAPHGRASDAREPIRGKSILLIVDCCYAALAGDPAILQGNGAQSQSYLREGLTILAASRKTESAHETAGHGVFTKLILGALNGGAADVRGRVSAASIYAYVEQALGSWDQRPMYKSYADYLPPVRLCKSSVPDNLLRDLPKLFAKEDTPFHMSPSFEITHPTAKPRDVALFNKFKALRNANLLTTQIGRDLYYIALDSAG